MLRRAMRVLGANGPSQRASASATTLGALAPQPLDQPRESARQGARGLDQRRRTGDAGAELPRLGLTGLGRGTSTVGSRLTTSR